MMDHQADEVESGRGSRTFWLRMVDNAFRRKWLFIVPVVLFSAFGVVQAGKTVATYQSTGVLSAESNPLVIDQSVRGATFEAFESAAEGTSRIINERLRTNAFTGEVARRAGLQAGLDLGLISLDAVRNNVWAVPGGNSLLDVNAQWGDPQSSYQLVAATIATYQDYLAETVARDSSVAEEYYQGLRDAATTELTAAENELTALLDELPIVDSGDERPIEDAIRIENLNDRIEVASTKVSSAQENIDAAQLAVLQSRSEAGRSLQVIDEPRVPVQPQATLLTTIQLIVSMFLLGVIVGAAAILITTALDRSVGTAGELAALPGIVLVATVPPIGAGTSGRKRKSKRRSKGKSNTRKPRPPEAPAEAADTSGDSSDDTSDDSSDDTSDNSSDDTSDDSSDERVKAQ